MAESQDDKAVDAAIADIRSALNRLEQAQKKDVADESGEDYGGQEPKNLKGAERQAFTIVREHRRRVRSSGEQSGKPDASDQLK